LADRLWPYLDDHIILFRKCKKLLQLYLHEFVCFSPHYFFAVIHSFSAVYFRLPHLGHVITNTALLIHSNTLTTAGAVVLY